LSLQFRISTSNNWRRKASRSRLSSRLKYLKRQRAHKDPIYHSTWRKRIWIYKYRRSCSILWSSISASSWDWFEDWWAILLK
jgi:hypothetical protein